MTRKSKGQSDAFRSMALAGLNDVQPEQAEVPAPEPTVPEPRPRRPKVPTPAAVPVPAAFQRPVRENLGLRIQTAFKTNLDGLTYQLRGQGWDIGHTDILEQLLRPVLDEAGRQNLIQELAELDAAPRPQTAAVGIPGAFVRAQRETLNTRVRQEFRVALGGLVNQLKGQGWRIEQNGIVEHLLQPLLTDEGRQRLTRQLAGLE